ncbi:DUF202 domain-containing protein [Streptomyces sp. SID6673]|nr:DUF202 domain-containing protein [Streptomyces sp. SID11726]NEB26731.1 DUF202 domain-containing protein [Streptomyces sp. SID6673]
MTTAEVGVDRGLQAERTIMSWTRTSIAVGANGLLVAGRDLVSHPDEWIGLRWAIGALAAVLAIAIYIAGRRRARDLTRRPLPRPVAVPRLMACTCVAITLLSVALLITATL